MGTSTGLSTSTCKYTRKKPPEQELTRKVFRRIKKGLRASLKKAYRTPDRPQSIKPYIKVELLIEPCMEVELYRYLGFETNGYSICPRCGYALEREYQRYCEQCGQLLGWERFSRGKITIQRKIVLSKEDRNSAGAKVFRSIQCEQHFLRWGGLKDGRRQYYSIKKKGRPQPGSAGEAGQCKCEYYRNV